MYRSIAKLKMADYERMSTTEVQQLAKQGDKDALYEMKWRTELVQPAVENSPQPDLVAWQDYWTERAANAGSYFARFKYADFLLNNPCSDDSVRIANRKKAFDLFENVVKNRDKLQSDEKCFGMAAEIELGMLLCEGICKLDGSDRNPEQGVKHINAGVMDMNNSGGLNFGYLHRLGELYACGYTQKGEEASMTDLNTSIAYFEAAISKFPSDGNPIILEGVQEMLDIQKRRRNTMSSENTIFPGARERREEMWTQSDEVKRGVLVMEEAMRRLRERLAREGW